jgi:hypothetical protein
MGWLCVRRPGHYCRPCSLWLFRAQASAPTARDCQRIAGAKGIFRRARYSTAWPSLSFRHRLWGGGCLPCGEPGFWLLDRTCSRFGGSVRCGRLFLHESHRVTALGCSQAAVFHADDDYRRGHTHLLCRASHISQRAPIFEMIESRSLTTRCTRLMNCSGR